LSDLVLLALINGVVSIIVAAIGAWVLWRKGQENVRVAKRDVELTTEVQAKVELVHEIVNGGRAAMVREIDEQRKHIDDLNGEIRDLQSRVH